jgi:hypothetical protein
MANNLINEYDWRFKIKTPLLKVRVGKIDIPEEVLRKVTRAALNRTVKKANTLASRKVREVYNIKAQDLKNFVKFKYADSNNSESQLIVRERKLPFDYFPFRKIRIGRTKYGKDVFGAEVKVKKGKGYTKLKRFVATMPSGKVSIFEREKGYRHRQPTKGPKAISGVLHGLKIHKVLTVGPTKMYEKEGEAAIRKVFKEDLTKIFKSQLEFRLTRKNK